MGNLGIGWARVAPSNVSASSAARPSERPDARRMNSPKPATYAVAGIAAVVIAFGAYTLGNSNSSGGSSGTANAAAANGRGFPQGGQVPQNGQAPPGFGTPATGASADKAKAAALAKYKGSVEQVMKLSDGSYVVHVITSNGEYHVRVSKDFKVTGAAQGGPGGGGVPGGSAPSGTAPPSGKTS
jgi:hypothetical protein